MSPFMAGNGNDFIAGLFYLVLINFAWPAILVMDVLCIIWWIKRRIPIAVPTLLIVIFGALLCLFLNFYNRVNAGWPITIPWPPWTSHERIRPYMNWENNYVLWINGGIDICLLTFAAMCSERHFAPTLRKVD